MSLTLIKKNQCRRCGLIFYLCRSCWRGQAYCGDPCRLAARGEKHREAQHRYRQTEKGREAHRKAERRRRMKKSKKTVDDQGSTVHACDDSVPSNRSGKEIRCHFCGSYGVVVKDFPRRGYGGKRYFPSFTLEALT